MMVLFMMVGGNMSMDLDGPDHVPPAFLLKYSCPTACARYVGHTFPFRRSPSLGTRRYSVGSQDKHHHLSQGLLIHLLVLSMLPCRSCCDAARSSSVNTLEQPRIPLPTGSHPPQGEPASTIAAAWRGILLFVAAGGGALRLLLHSAGYIYPILRNPNAAAGEKSSTNT